MKYLPQMQDGSSRSYLFVAIDRATRWVFVQFKTNQDYSQCQGLPEGIAQDLPDQDHQGADRQWLGVYRSLVGQPAARVQ